VTVAFDQKGKLGDRLLRVREQSRPTLELCFNRMFERPDARQRFICYMVQTYHYVSFACPLMEHILANKDRLPSEMVKYLEQNLVEEAGHEQWVLDDLERLGFERKRVQASRPLRQTASLVGSQYFWIEKPQPAACFGYMFTLERTAATPELHKAGITSISERVGIGMDALTNYSRHGELDFDHQEDKIDLLNTVKLDTNSAEAILQNCRETTLNLCDLFVEIAEMPASQLPL
jgi:pyrroloquinoline quinone (PQQ) biosynthesis protein C